MQFSAAQYETVVHTVAKGNDDLREAIPRISAVAAMSVGHWYVPDSVKQVVRWCADTMASLLKGIADIVSDLLKGAVAPVRMFFDGYAWQDLRGLATGVSGRLKPTALHVDEAWTGSARDAYVAAITPQSQAADRLARISERTCASLYLCAAAGMTFYVALGVILTKLVIAAVTAIAALGSAVFSWVGVAIIYEEAAIDTGLFIALISSFVLLMGVQATEMGILHGEAIDAATFPQGRWPDPATGTYSDATVKDGDADWSLRRMNQ